MKSEFYTCTLRTHVLGYALEIPGLYKRRNLESRGHQVKKLWAEPKFNLMKECVASLLRF